MENDTTNAPASPRLLRLDEVTRRVGFGKSALYDRIRNGTFPVPVKVGPQISCWVESEIDLWIAERIAARRAPRLGARVKQ